MACNPEVAFSAGEKWGQRPRGVRRLQGPGRLGHPPRDDVFRVRLPLSLFVYHRPGPVTRLRDCFTYTATVSPTSHTSPGRLSWIIFLDTIRVRNHTWAVVLGYSRTKQAWAGPISNRLDHGPGPSSRAHNKKWG